MEVYVFPTHYILKFTDNGQDYIVYDVWILFELIVVYFLFVETSGASLEEMAAIIDGEDVRNNIVEAVARATDGKTVDSQTEVVEDKKPYVVVA